MMTIQKPKRMWQKKKDYMRKKTIRGLRRKGKQKYLNISISILIMTIRSIMKDFIIPIRITRIDF